jgi:hypothetical protein
MGDSPHSKHATCQRAKKRTSSQVAILMPKHDFGTASKVST